MEDKIQLRVAGNKQLHRAVDIPQGDHVHAGGFEHGGEVCPHTQLGLDGETAAGHLGLHFKQRHAQAHTAGGTCGVKGVDDLLHSFL